VLTASYKSRVPFCAALVEFHPVHTVFDAPPRVFVDQQWRRARPFLFSGCPQFCDLGNLEGRSTGRLESKAGIGLAFYPPFGFLLLLIRAFLVDRQEDIQFDMIMHKGALKSKQQNRINS
jgi:hypothetical protein